MTPVETGAQGASIRDLFRREHVSATLLLGAAIGIEALEFYVATSLMPSMVRDIGGLELLAWTTSLFIAAIVLGGVAVIIRPAGMTLNRVYVLGALVFAVGCLIVGIAPTMIVVLIGRFVQGFGAGLLVTMGYSFIRYVYPEGMQNAASAFYSALWGVSTLLGPAIGGLFSAGSGWRWAFLLLIPLALMMAFFAPRALPAGDDPREKQPFPGLQIALITAGILAISFAGTVEGAALPRLLLVAGLLTLLLIVVAERMGRARLFPGKATALTHPLGQAYLVMFMIIAVLNSDIYVPYFLQTLHSTSPLIAGFIVALVATGWSAAGILTASWQGRSAQGAMLAGPIVLFVSVNAVAWLISTPSPAGDALHATLICIALFSMGTGIGLGWAHLVSICLTRAEADEADKASAAINLIASLGAAFGAAIAGVIANGAGLVSPGGVEGGVSAAFWLYTLISTAAVIAVFAAIPLWRSLSD